LELRIFIRYICDIRLLLFHAQERLGGESNTMDTSKVAAAVLGVLAVSLAIAPAVLATASSSNYPFELNGRMEYIAPAGTPNPFGSAVQTLTFDVSSPAVFAPPSGWVWAATSSYTTHPGHGI
jgi:hypothetical protein